MRLLAHDSSFVVTLAQHHIRPKTNLFLSENEKKILLVQIMVSDSGGCWRMLSDKLRWKNGQSDSQFWSWI